MADEPDEKPSDAAAPPALPDASVASPSDASGTSRAETETVGRDAPAATDAPKKKKRKKKRAIETGDGAEAEKPAGPVLTEEGWERPGFVLDFPKDPELERLVRAFELGNYAFVRESGKKLAESASDAAVRRAAGELVRRIEPDPLVKILFAMSVALFVFMVFYAYRSHGH